MRNAATEALNFLAGEAITNNENDLMAFTVDNPLIENATPPALIVRPKNEEELQQIVQAANQSQLNLTVSSSGGKHRSSALAAEKDHLHIDLSGWKAIPWINRRNRVCQIQPGVTYGELLEALRPHGMTVPLPLAPRSGKSVIAAVMDRQPAIWPNKQWDISDPVASTEFIFGNGELFRTGAAGGPGSLEEQRAAGGAQKCPLGPSQTDFHRVIQGSQGTMGIVTWITLRTELLPSIEEPFLLGADSLDALTPFIYEVQRPWLGEHSLVLNNTAVDLLMSAAGGQVPGATSAGLPEFICLQNIAGFERYPKQRLKYQKTDIRKIADKHGLEMSSTIGALSARELLDTARTPCGETDWRQIREGHCLSIFFLSTLDRAGLYINLIRELVKHHGLAPDSLGIYIQPVVQNHACHLEFFIPYNPGRAETLQTMKALEKEAVEKLTAQQAFFSRPYGHSQNLVFDQNPVNTDILKKTKDIFDPQRVLNAGKWNL